MAKPVKKAVAPVLVVYNIPASTQINEKSKENLKASEVTESLEKFLSK